MLIRKILVLVAKEIIKLSEKFVFFLLDLLHYVIEFLSLQLQEKPDIQDIADNVVG